MFNSIHIVKISGSISLGITSATIAFVIIFAKQIYISIEYNAKKT